MKVFHVKVVHKNDGDSNPVSCFFCQEKPMIAFLGRPLMEFFFTT